ncbi:MAG: DUF4331 family protein [Chloroflexota bacterium]
MPTTARSILIGIAATSLIALPAMVGAADHLDGPAVAANHAIDINDVYVFEGADAGNTVLSFDVNPAAGVISGTTFDPTAEYVINVDTNADAVEDIVYVFTFAAAAGGTQAYTVTKDGAPFLVGITGTTTTIGGRSVFAGLVDDPFFFDLDGFKHFKTTLLAGSADPSQICDANPDVNFFAGFNATAIVLEVPDADLGGANIGVWAETRIGGSQIDRMGKPAINTVFNTTDADKNAYNAAEPANDPADWTANVAGVTSAIRQALGEAPAAADAYGATLAGLLLPDVLNYDTTTAANYGAPLNGRALTDDVIDISYSVITDGLGAAGAPAVTSDCVANDSTFRPAFPYWGVANVAAATAAPSASTADAAVPVNPTRISGLLMALAALVLFGGLGALTVADVRRRKP